MSKLKKNIDINHAKMDTHRADHKLDIYVFPKLHRNPLLRNKGRKSDISIREMLLPTLKESKSVNAGASPYDKKSIKICSDHLGRDYSRGE